MPADLGKFRMLLDATAGHTPGPWSGDRLDGTVKYAARSADGRIVLTADHKSGRYGFVAGDSLGDDEIGGEHEADERLFLRGPDLRTALAKAVEEITTLRAALAGWPIAMAEAVRAAVAEAARFRVEVDELWSEINRFLHEEPCPACEDGPEPVRRWLHDGDRVACVCGHEGRVVGGEDSPAYLEWDEVAEVRG